MSSQSHYNSHPQPYSMDESPAPSGSDEELTDMPSPPSTSAIERELQSQKIHCMHIDNCDTQAPYRKAISHIFGRNKLCTRSIPDFVWVHYCRKHYQRMVRHRALMGNQYPNTSSRHLPNRFANSLPSAVTYGTGLSSNYTIRWWSSQPYLGCGVARQRRGS